MHDNFNGFLVPAHLDHSHIGLNIEVRRTGRAARRRIVFLDGVTARDGLGVRYVGRLTIYQLHVMFAGPQHRADFGTVSTGSTFGSIDVAGLLFESQVKSPRLPTHIEDIGIRKNLDIGMVGQFPQLRAHHAGRAIIGGKGLVELGHSPADSW